MFGRLRRMVRGMCFFSKRGHIVSEKTIGWLIWIFIAIAVGLSIRAIVSRAG